MNENVEVIARKSGNAESNNMIFIVLGILGIAADLFLWIILAVNGIFSIQSLRKEIGWAILLIALLIGILLVGIFFLRLGLRLYINNARLPDELIKYEDGEIVFADGYRCKPSDIVSADCFKVERDGTPKMKALRANPDSWIIITTKDRTIKYEQVEAVRDAYEKLMYYVGQSDSISKS